MDAATIRHDGEKFQVAGKLSFFNVMSLLSESMKHMQKTNQLMFDFSQVTASDSAGLALILEWIKLANLQNKKIILKNVSGELMSLARASSLDKIISSAAG